MENVVLKINGMACTGCSQRLERALKNTDGISDATVNFETREAKINYSKDTINLKEICNVVSEVGFEVEE